MSFDDFSPNRYTPLLPPTFKERLKAAFGFRLAEQVQVGALNMGGVVQTEVRRGSSLQDDPADVAKKLGLDVVEPGPDELFIDLDDEADRVVMEDMIKRLEENGVPIRRIKETESKSGNKHVYLSVPKGLTPIERVALQACMGSDRARELLALLRIMLDLKRPPTVFFEKPGLGRRVKE